MSLKRRFRQLMRRHEEILRIAFMVFAGINVIRGDYAHAAFDITIVLLIDAGEILRRLRRIEPDPLRMRCSQCDNVFDFHPPGAPQCPECRSVSVDRTDD